MKFCTKCGTKLLSEANFCTKCGVQTNKDSSMEWNTQTVSETSKNRKPMIRFIIISIIVLVILSVIILLLTRDNVLNSTKKLLESNLDESVKITSLYYNEEKRGCFVEFKTESYIETAVVHLNTKKIEYESEYNYYVYMAETLRNQTNIDEYKLHEYNQKIINSSYPEWSFAVSIVKASGETEKNGWKKIK